MSHFALYLKDRSTSEIIILARTIHERMSAEAAVFAHPPVSMAEFLSHIDQFSLHEQQVKGAGAVARALRNASLAQVKKDMKRLGMYVQIFSDGNENLIRAAGFDIARIGPYRHTDLEVPGNLRGFNNNDGSVTLRWKRVKYARTYMVECKEAGSPDESWRIVATCSVVTTRPVPSVSSAPPS
ncbi:MAG: fibronectin type III domain-containing protein, partial [Sphingobacteriales bacterium]